MRVRFADDVEAYAARVGALLEHDPVASTISLTVIASVRAGVAYAGPPTWSWVEDGGDVVGAASWTPPFHLCLSPMSEAAAEAVGRAWRSTSAPGVIGRSPEAERCAAALAAGRPVGRRTAERLFRLDAVTAPRRPPGRARLAAVSDRELATRWHAAFAAESGARSHDPAGSAQRAIASGGLWLWDDLGPVSMAGVRAPVAGVSRVGPVFTPPDRRGRGYARALVAAVSQARLDAGDVACCLFTDLANPVSNVIYQQIGYRPYADYAEIAFGGGAADAPQRAERGAHDRPI